MEKIDNYKVLEKEALELGCVDAKVIPANRLVVEDRVRLKCMVGCPTYGKNLKCPPYTPSTDKFRKILNEYSFAMVIKIKPPEISDELTAKYKPGENEETRLWNRYQDVDKISSMIWEDFSDHYKTMLTTLLEIERAAFNHGNAFAMVFFGGKCMLCEKCNVKNGACLNPMMARFAAEAVGINMLETAKNAGMELKFNTKDNQSPITPMAILLID